MPTSCFQVTLLPKRAALCLDKGSKAETMNCDREVELSGIHSLLILLSVLLCWSWFCWSSTQTDVIN